MIRDRNLPIARIVPIEKNDADPDEASLVASGLMRLPKRPLDFERFWTIGGRARRDRKMLKAIDRAIEREREEKDVRFLEHKRNHPHLRSRPGK